MGLHCKMGSNYKGLVLKSFPATVVLSSVFDTDNIGINKQVLGVKRANKAPRQLNSFHRLHCH